MLLSRRLTGLLCAAIFVIAGQFIADAAWAHSGHAHARAITAQVPADQTVQPRPAASKAAPIEAAKPSLALRAGDDAQHPAAPQSGGCTGGCCGYVGCCGVVLTAASPALANIQPDNAIISPALHGHPGLDPRALIRPPRNLA